MKMAQQLDAPLDCAPAKGTWLLTFKARLRRRESQDIVLGGSLIMLLSTTLVSGVNFFYNVAMARMMGPSEFGHVTAAVPLLMLASGYGVLGAVGAISASVIVACVLPPVPKQLQVQPLPGIRPSMHEAFQAMIFFVGQVIINNVDILMVKHFFPPEQAGLYAAVALIGRVLYLAAWSIVSAMFPVSAASKEHAEQQQGVFLPMVLVLGVVVVFVLTVSFLPQARLHDMFGAQFAEGGPLLALYPAATGLSALSVVMMAYEMSRRKASTAWLQLIFSGGVILAISIFHHDLRQVIVVQVVLMALMLLLVSAGFVRRQSRVLAEEAAAA